MKTPSGLRMTVVVMVATAAWLIPLAWSLLRQRGARPRPVTETRSADSAAREGTRPLILYVDAWPTRAKLDLREIQGLTSESEGTLAPAKVADHLYSELGRLGIKPEIHRIDRLPPQAALESFRPVVVVYPVRHGRPAAAIGQFIEQRIEPFIARHSGPRNLAITDLAVAETSEIAAAAQATLAATAAYYGVPYAAGPRLGPQVSLYAQNQLLAEQAAVIRSEVAR